MGRALWGKWPVRGSKGRGRERVDRVRPGARGAGKAGSAGVGEVSRPFADADRKAAIEPKADETHTMARRVPPKSAEGNSDRGQEVSGGQFAQGVPAQLQRCGAVFAA